MATSVTEQPRNAPGSEPLPGTTTGDPVLDGLGTAEATTPGTGPEGAFAEPVEPAEVDEVIEVVEVVEEEPTDAASGDATPGEDTGDDPEKSTGRRRKS
jgi:hypothetical protein